MMAACTHEVFPRIARTTILVYQVYLRNVGGLFIFVGLLVKPLCHTSSYSYTTDTL